jgi:hypothetical protein
VQVPHVNVLSRTPCSGCTGGIRIGRNADGRTQAGKATPQAERGERVGILETGLHENHGTLGLWVSGRADRWGDGNPSFINQSLRR